MANLPQLKICKNHKAIHFFSSRTGRNFDWDFVVDDLIKSVSVRGRVSVNDGDAYIDLALQGFGIIQGPRYMLTNHLESGLLKEVLPRWTPAPMPISAVYLQNPHLSLKVKVFVGEFKHEVRQFQKPYDNQQAEQISLMV